MGAKQVLTGMERHERDKYTNASLGVLKACYDSPLTVRGGGSATASVRPCECVPVYACMRAHARSCMCVRVFARARVRACGLRLAAEHLFGGSLVQALALHVGELLEFERRCGVRHLVATRHAH